FQVTKTKPKIGRNPNKPDAAVPIPARAVVKFKPGKELKEKVAKVLPELETTD
ncbi:MAG: HU family DNA-binding protein, partial [Verrucomicrobiales bacterium]|nr:HU family DNA-binding protein [Verrucomicrobiales bacterium]